MPGFDPRAWNLFGALALALPACGQEMADAHASGSPEADDEDDYYPGCGQVGDGASLRCSPEYYDEDDYDHPIPGCKTHAECGEGNICRGGSCVPGDVMPECGDTFTFDGGIPLPEDAEGAVALAAIDVDDDLKFELVVRVDDGVSLVDPAAGTVKSVGEGASTPVAGVVGRFDASTPSDLVLYDGGSLYMARNDGAGGLEAPVVFGTVSGALGPVAGDFDGDGNLDVYIDGRLRPGDGAGGFSYSVWFTGLQPGRPIARYDGDLDAADELVGLGWETSVLSSLDFVEGIEPLEPTYGGTMLDLLTADLDGDTVADIVRLVYGSSDASILNVLPGDQLVPQSTELGVPHRSRSIRPADLDGDGHLELVAFGDATDRVVIYRNFAAGAPCFTQTDIVARAVVAADFDGDGRDELAASDAEGTAVFGVE